MRQTYDPINSSVAEVPLTRQEIVAVLKESLSKDITRGAATRYLMRTTGSELHKQFLPIIRETLDETSATRYYGDIVKLYNALPLVADVNPDLDQYATDKAIDGLFVLIAEEEANIRADPVARTTALLRRVFGSLD